MILFCPKYAKTSCARKALSKFWCFPGAKFDDFYHCAIPPVNKKPDRIVFHMGTNNAPYCTAGKMVDQVLGLKLFILRKLPSFKIIISTPTPKADNATANKRNNLFVNHLKKLNNIEKKNIWIIEVCTCAYMVLYWVLFDKRILG